MLLRTLNAQKNVIRKHGINEDGKTYKITFTGTVDETGLATMNSSCISLFKGKLNTLSQEQCVMNLRIVRLYILRVHM